MQFSTLVKGAALAMCFHDIPAMPVAPESIVGTMERTLSNGSIVEEPYTFSPEEVAMFRDQLQLSPRTLQKRAPSQYLNFDDTLDTDITHLAQLKQGWQDGIELASIVYNTWDDAVAEGIVGHYFGSSDFDSAKTVFLSK